MNKSAVAQNKAPMPHAGTCVAYVLRRYPTLSETFISSEIHTLPTLGVQPIVLSLLDSNLRATDETADATIVRLPFGAPDAWARMLATCLVHPLWFLRATRLAMAAMGDEFGSGLRVLALTPKLVYFAALCRRSGVRHVHSHFSGMTSLCGQSVARMLGVGFSFMYHTLPELDNPLVARNVAFARRVLANSRCNLRMLGERFGDRVLGKTALVRSGLGLTCANPEELAQRSARVDVLAIGRLVRKKGFDVLLMALAELQARGRKVSCWIIGNGPEYGALERQICEAGLARVQLLGSRSNDETQRLIREARLFVLPCRRVRHVGSGAPAGDREDGLPVAITEALAVGVPVISCDLGGVAEVVLEGQTGRLVPQEDPVALASAIESLLENEPERLRMGRQAIELIGREYDKSGILRGLCEAFGLSDPTIAVD